VVTALATKCETLVVYQHEADDKTKRIHCHILIETKLADNAIRETRNKVLGDKYRKDDHWIASKVQKGEHKGKPLSIEALLVYASKGKYDPSYVKLGADIPSSAIAEAKSAWKSQQTPSEKTDSMEALVAKCYEKTKESYDKYRFYRKNGDDRDDVMAVSAEDLFNHSRNETWKMLWARNRLAPHPPQYKMIATSVFMRICEDKGMFSEGLEVIKEKWY